MEVTYEFLDKNSNKVVAVYRKMGDNTPPSDEEAREGGINQKVWIMPESASQEPEVLDGGLTDDEVGAAEWTKILSAGTQLLKSDAWGVGKGYW